jgi:hypothetical protein
MTAASEPYRKKSYHSKPVPRLEARITRPCGIAARAAEIGALALSIFRSPTIGILGSYAARAY